MVLDSDGVYGKEPKSAIPKRKKRRVTSPVRSTSSFGSGASVGSSHVTHYDPPSIPTSVSLVLQARLKNRNLRSLKSVSLSQRKRLNLV